MTIRDVAKYAGVSVATVSRVINNTDNVKEETKLLVHKAIKDLNYSPNLLGRNLRRQETKRILVILNSISNQFFSRVIKGIEEKAKENGYRIMICTTRGNRETILEHIDMLHTKVVDGAILLSPELEIEELSELNNHFPVVCACEPIREPVAAVVCIDNIKAGRDAVNYLISQGKRRIAVITSDNYGSCSFREEGYVIALREHGLEMREEYIIREGLTYNSGVRAAKRFMKLKEMPDAVFAFADSVAIGLIKEFNKNGIKVPADISVMGFDNTAMSEVYIPSLTTVAQPQYEIGYRAMDLLISRIHGDRSVSGIVLEHEIIKRESVIKTIPSN